RTRSIALKPELHSLKLGDLSIDAYFRKIKSIATILTSLRSPISNDDVVTIALEGLPYKYENVSGIIVHREPFSNLKTVHFMQTIEEMSLKSRAQAKPTNSTSSSHMVLLANACNNTCRTVVAPVELNKPCFNFAKGFCCFVIIANLYMGVHLMRVSPLGQSTVSPITTQSAHPISFNIGLIGPAQSTSHIHGPLGFNLPQPASTLCSQSNGPINGQPAQQQFNMGHNFRTVMGQHTSPGTTTLMGQSCSNILVGHETLLPNGFSVMTLQDPTPGN
ncbi:hypothetical protein Tco_0760791, partial [Tanacetum coccineum]